MGADGIGVVLQGVLGWKVSTGFGTVRKYFDNVPKLFDYEGFGEHGSNEFNESDEWHS